jgi:predicted secreted protein
MKQLIFVLLLLSEFCAQAGDSFHFHNLGFSPNGLYFSYANTVMQDGSGFPFAKVYIVDVLANTPVSYQSALLKDDKLSEQEALDKAKSQTDFKKYSITPGRDLGSEESLNKMNEHHVTFSNANGDYDITVLEFDAGNRDASGYCGGMAPESKLITVTLSKTTKGQEQSIIMQRDVRQPPSRMCSYNYIIEKVLTQDRGLVVIISFQTPGFEGPDTKHMSVSGELP